MPVLLDLDNTLVNRTGAFRRWAEAFADELGFDSREVDWLMDADRDGYAPRTELAARIKGRFKMGVEIAVLVDRLLYEHVEHIEAYDGVLARLATLAENDVAMAIVTNGTALQQTMKLRRSGISALVPDAIISEQVQAKKPDERMFRRALEIGRHSACEAWMIGDHPTADIEGAGRRGIRSGWVSHGRVWRGLGEPTVIGRTTVDVLDQIAIIAAASHKQRRE